MMSDFEIVAHRGVPTDLPENTVPSFQRAIDLGADVNDEQSLNIVAELNIPRICTDRLQQVLDFRQQIKSRSEHHHPGRS